MEGRKEEVLVYVFNGYADWEPAYISAELNMIDSDYVIKTVSTDGHPVKSMGGFQITPDYSLNNSPEKFALLILPGGAGWGNINKPLISFTKRIRESNIPIAAICDATNFLAENGFLDNIKHTGNTLSFMKLRSPNYKGEANYIDKQSVCDGGIVTANGSAVLEFTKNILLLLEAKPKLMISEWYHLHKDGFCKK